MKLNVKLTINAKHNGSATKKIAQSRSPKIAFPLLFYVTEKHQIYIIEDFHKKE